MAKKDKQEYSFMTRPLPKEAGRFNSVMRTFAGLNYRNTLDSGQWAWEKGLSTNEYPCLVPARKWEEEDDLLSDKDTGGNNIYPLSMHMFGKYMFIVYTQDTHGTTNAGQGKRFLFVDRINLSDSNSKVTGYIGIISSDDNRPRELIAFNRFDDEDNTVVNGRFVTQIIVLPDKVYMPIDVKFAYSNATENDASHDEGDPRTLWYTFLQYVSAHEGEIDKNAIYCYTQKYAHTHSDTITTYHAYNESEEAWKQIGKKGKSHTHDEFGYFALTELDVDIVTFENEGTYVPTSDKVGDSSKHYYRHNTQTTTSSAPPAAPGSSSGGNSSSNESSDTTPEWDPVTVADYDDVSGLYECVYYPINVKSRSGYYYNTSSGHTGFYTYDDRTNSLGNVVGWQELLYAPVFPNMDHGAVYLSRLFGVGDGKIYASGYNNFGNWAFDIGDEHNDYSPWCSATGANTKAGGEFTAITSYQNHVIAFKKDFMHEIYNTKNPFTVHDVYACGCVSARTVQEVGGKLIFAAPEGIMIYTGSKPRLISYELNKDTFDHNCCSGSDGRCYYLFYINANDVHYPYRMFVYDTWTECWSEEVCEREIISFAFSPDYGMYRLEITDSDGHGVICKQGNSYGDWECETDLMTTIRNQRRKAHQKGVGMTDISHIQRLTIMCDMSSGSELRAYLIYDDEPHGADFDADKARLIAEVYDREGRVNVRVVPRMSAHYGFRVRLEGTGYIKIYGMEIEQEAGGVRDVISGGLE